MEVNFEGIKVIGFDADDTLWVNETYFRDAEEQFAQLLEKYETKNKIDQELFRAEIKGSHIYIKETSEKRDRLPWDAKTLNYKIIGWKEPVNPNRFIK